MAGYAARALSRGGLVAATSVGLAILGRTGWCGLAALGSFFVGATLISRLAPDPAAARLDAKGGTRDPIQVFANGGAAALAAILATSPEAALWAVTASLAAAAADTWATACGGWSRSDPRHLVTLRRVPPGTSGAVSLAGTAGAFAGAATVGLAAVLAGGSVRLLPLALAVGMTGMLLDSAAGAMIQGRFRCDLCGQDTERPVHRCGSPARLRGGLPWVSNDSVNALATASAAILGWAAFAAWGASPIPGR